MRVLYITSEVYPFAKTGGLADVSAALPAALRELGIDVRLLVPGYPQAIERAADPQEVHRFGNLLGCGDVRLVATRLPQADARVSPEHAPKKTDARQTRMVKSRECCADAASRTQRDTNPSGESAG